MTEASKNKTSRYALKGAAYQYSAHLRAWQRAKIAGHERDADDAARAHERQFNYRRFKNGRGDEFHE